MGQMPNNGLKPTCSLAEYMPLNVLPMAASGRLATRVGVEQLHWPLKQVIFLCTDANLRVKIGGYAHEGHN